jgi:hypothetical protein
MLAGVEGKTSRRAFPGLDAAMHEYVGDPIGNPQNLQ